MMESAIGTDPLVTSAFSPASASAIHRTLATAAQMSQYGNGNGGNHHHHHNTHGGPYSSIFNVSSVIAEQLSVSRVASTTFGISPVVHSSSSAAAMLQNRLPELGNHHHHQYHHSYLPERSSSIVNSINNNVLMGSLSEVGSPAPSTDGDSIVDQFHAEENYTTNSDDNKLLTFKRAMQASNHHFGNSNKMQDARSYSPKEQDGNLINNNHKNGSGSPIGKKQRQGKTVSH